MRGWGNGHELLGKLFLHLPHVGVDILVITTFLDPWRRFFFLHTLMRLPRSSHTAAVPVMGSPRTSIYRVHSTFGNFPARSMTFLFFFFFFPEFPRIGVFYTGYEGNGSYRWSRAETLFRTRRAPIGAHEDKVAVTAFPIIIDPATWEASCHVLPPVSLGNWYLG